MDIYAAINARRTIRDFEDRPIDMRCIERILEAGLKAPSNDHLRCWEFVIVNDKEKRAEILGILPNRVLSCKGAINELLDTWALTDPVQRDMYHEALPKQYEMLYRAGCLILPFFRQSSPLLAPKTLSSLNAFASIWCCVQNILLAAAGEGIFGVTRIPFEDEVRHVQSVVHHPDDYVMPCYIALGYPADGAAINAQKEIAVQDKIHIDAWRK